MLRVQHVLNGIQLRRACEEDTPAARRDLMRYREAIARCNFVFSSEEELQAGVALALEQAGLEFQREAILPGRLRLDFLGANGVAIEVKVGGSPAELVRQCQKYLARAEVAGIVVVSSVPQHQRYLSALGDRVTAVIVGGL